MKLKIKYTFIIAFLMCFVSIAVAQSDVKRDKIDALRASFIAKKVNFTTQEAQLFWPLYNEMNDKQDAARKTFRLQYNANTNFNFETDKEAETAVEEGDLQKITDRIVSIVRVSEGGATAVLTDFTLDRNENYDRIIVHGMSLVIGIVRFQLPLPCTTEPKTLD